MIWAIYMTAVCLVLAVTPAQADQPAVVFLLIGQSNMAGRAEMLEPDTLPIQSVSLLNDRGAWEPARQPLNRFATDHKGLGFQRFNLGGPFATALKNSDTSPSVGLIVNARGGTKIESWQPGEDLYENAINRVLAMEGTRLAGVLWHQGESNRHDTDYGDKLKQLILALRKDLNQPDLPFIAGHISGENSINEQMDELAVSIPRVAVVTVQGLKRFDGTHYDRDSLIALGKRYARVYSSLVDEPEE